MKPEEVRRIAELNAECICFDDKYSDYDDLVNHIKNRNLHYHFVKCGGETVGYILYRIKPTHIESVRRGVARAHRRQGYGSVLTKYLQKIARRENKSIYTYISKTNLPSLNGNLKLGYIIRDISDHWVYVEYHP